MELLDILRPYLGLFHSCFPGLINSSIISEIKTFRFTFTPTFEIQSLFMLHLIIRCLVNFDVDLKTFRMIL